MNVEDKEEAHIRFAKSYYKYQVYCGNTNVGIDLMSVSMTVRHHFRGEDILEVVLTSYAISSYTLKRLFLIL